MKIYTSPLDADTMNTKRSEIGSPRLYNGRLYYTKTDPHTQHVRIYSQNITEKDSTHILPDTVYSVGTRINVYGGECLCPCPYGIVFADTISGALCSIHNGAISQLLDTQAYWYADIVYHANTIFYIAECRETHTQSLRMYDFTTQTETRVAEGADFYHCPTAYKDKIAWLEWDATSMPWDNSRIVCNGNVISGGCGHFQPTFDTHGNLYYAKDTGAYHHIFCNDTNLTPHCAMDFYQPLWVYGMRTFCIANDTVYATGAKQGKWAMGYIAQGHFTPLPTSASTYTSIHANDGYVIYHTSHPNRPNATYTLDTSHHTIQKQVQSAPLPICDTYISIPRDIHFQNDAGHTVYALYYPPKNPDINTHAPPPLLVKSHGGPTGQTDSGYNQKIQFWTTRGFAVLDVNYSGSTGYGSAYRDRLRGLWGVLDVGDLASGALYCIQNRLAHPEHICISGSSAGGYAVLCALQKYGDIFKAGCSVYGIGDLHKLVSSTHKFEAHYFDSLIAPYDSNPHIYDSRSPILQADRFSTPILVLQGTHDPVVPPEQAHQIYESLRTQNIDTALILYESEGHGFKNTQAKSHALYAELEFYQSIFNGVTPSYPINEITRLGFE